MKETLVNGPGYFFKPLAELYGTFFFVSLLN